MYVAGLLVLDASSEDPLTAFQQLLKQPGLPHTLKSGLADGHVLKHYVLIDYNREDDR